MSTPVTDPGRLVAGRYRLQTQIGGGGMGAVWLARDELLGRQVAVKQVLVAESDPALAEQQRQRALREGRIAARLNHPHTISVYDVAQEGPTPWLVMEYLPSRSLAEVVATDGVLRVDQVAQIGAQVADALAATHAAGIVHRDVKPANILIGRGERIEGLVKITDFGISHAHGDVTLTQTGQITGTPAFLAPEVAQGFEMGEASDVFSLGATLYTCLEGQPPFGMEDNALAMLHKVAAGSIRPPVRAGSLSGPLTRMLATDPADRPTMVEVRDELAKLAAGRSGNTTTVLLARTDLNSARAGRNATSALPAEVAAVAGPAPASPQPAAPPAPTRTELPAVPASTRVAAASGTVAPEREEAPAAAPPPGSAAPPAPRGGRRRRRILLALAALAAVLAAGLVLFLTVGQDDDPSDQAAATTSSAPSARETDEAEETESTRTGSPGTGSPGSTGASPTTAAESPVASQPSPAPAPVAADPASATAQFFGSVPGDLRSAYARTSPRFQAQFPYEQRFAFFWGQFSDVQISDVVAESGTSALATITFVGGPNGTETERHRLTFVPGPDGSLLLDSDVAL